MNKLIDAFFYGNLELKDYEYSFVYNNETIKADSCGTSFYNTYCVVGNDYYKNVEYTYNFVGTRIVYNPLLPFITFCILNVIIYFIISFIIREFLFRG